MLISFSFENYMSFRDEISFSMIAGRERRHGNRIPKIEKYNLRVLPTAAIYGGNASGKTNFCKALNFAKGFITETAQPDVQIQVKSYGLDDESMQLPSRFKFLIMVNENIYEYSFAVTRKEVLEEKLLKITSTSEKIIYSRRENKLNLGQSYKKDKRLQYAFEGTRDNQLFLNNTISQKINTFKPVYDWFLNSLIFVGPDTRFGPFEEFLDEKHPLFLTMNEVLQLLDTGISHIGGEEIPFEAIKLPGDLKSKLKDYIKPGMTAKVGGSPVGDLMITADEEGKLTVKKLVSYHLKTDGSEVPFEMTHESDGSKRVINLLPAFLEISMEDSDKVFIIDELDRSLHTLLTRQLLETYLKNCSANSRSQLLFTTHDVFLMNQELLRRDEMWVIERDSVGNSSMISFSEYKDIRYDKDIRKSYLQGRLGGIPHILLCRDDLDKYND